MSGKHQGLRYFQKFLNSKVSERNALAKKVLRYVLAVGFVLSPWLGGEAYAASNIVRADSGPAVNFNNKVADVMAGDASGTVGLNCFQSFSVDKGDTVNLHFQTVDGKTVNTLVNTVQDKISISGTVNGIRNGKVDGSLYFLSPNGMVVGSSGVINAGSLTMITSGATLNTAAEAANAIETNAWTLNSSASINIQGQINTATGIDLRAVAISMSKDTADDAPVPALKTGMVFEQVVNTGDLYTYKVKENERLSASVVDGEVVVSDPSNDVNATGIALIQGDGGIKLSTSVTNSGDVTIKNGTLGAIGDLSIEAGGNINLNNIDIEGGKKTIHAVAGYVSIEDDDAITLNNADIDAGGSVNIIANYNNLKEDYSGTITLTDSTVDAVESMFFCAYDAISLKNTNIHTDSDIELRSKWYESTTEYGGTISVDGGSIDAIEKIELNAGARIELLNDGSINSINNQVRLNCSIGTELYGDVVLDNGNITAQSIKFDVGRTITINEDATITVRKSTTDTTNESTVNISTELGSITNYGRINIDKDLNMVAGNSDAATQADITNHGNISTTSDGVGVSLTAKNNITNYGTIQTSGQITFTVSNTLINRGTINSSKSNVQAHIGRDFKNIAVYDNESSENRTLIGGIIEAGGNVQVDYPLERPASQTGTDGIFNSGLIWAVGENGKDPVYDDEGNIKDSGSGNIWLTSSYNITNYGTMEAGRQITLNARDFLHNYGLIEGVTYLDIKSIMGYVYNHKDATIRAKGGNIDLSSGQANLVIDKDTDGQKKELYRKFTPIIIEGLVEATSDDDVNNQTKEGNIKITAHLGDIYINGGTIETKPELGTNNEVKSVAGDVILDADQNITIGFETVKDFADDPTTDGTNANIDDEREYYKPKVDDTSGKLVSGTAANISGTNITLTSGSGANTISMSAVNNLTASDTVNFETAEMDFAGGTITANKINASGQLNVTGGSLSSASGGSLTISGAEGLTLGAGAGISTDKDLTITSEKGSILNNAALTANNGSLTMSGAGSVNAGTVTGKDVVLSSGGGSGITADKIIVDNSLQLQGNDIAVTEIDRSNNPDVLKVDVFGAGGANSAVQGDLQLNIAGDVLFNTMNVTNADVTVGGALGVDKLHVEGEAHFTSNEQKIGVFGDVKAPVDDDSDALYRDLGDGNNSWMSITMDSEGYAIKNGSEINNIFGDGTVDPVEMSTKLLDFDPHETFVETFGTSVNIFSRMDLIEAPERPAGDIAPVPQGGKTVLKHDANGLRIEEEKEEKR